MKQDERISETERLLHLILANIDDLIAVVDLDGRRLYNSPSYEALFGPRDRLRGTDSFGDIHPDDRAMVRGVFEETVRTGVGKRIVYRFARRDGSVRYIESQGNVIRDAHGKPEKVIVVGRDITERRRSEQILTEAEAKFRSLVEQSLVGVYMVQEGRFVHVNPKLASIFGYDQMEMMAFTGLADIIAADDRMAVQETVNGMMQTPGANMHMTIHGLRKDGTINDVEIFASVTEFNGFPALLGTVLDITERRRAEEERTRLYSAVEQTMESVIITDAAGTIQYVNPAFERVTGFSRAEALGQNPRILKSGAQPAEFYRTMWATLKRGEVWAGSLINKRKDGTTYQEEMVISPVRDGAGNVVNYVAVKRDVTRERQIEEHLRQNQKMESLRQLAGGMAHDFNNILNVLLGTFTLLRTRLAADPTSEKYLSLGEGAVKRGIDVARRLGTFAQLESTQKIPLSAGTIVRDVKNALQTSIEKTVRIETDVEPDLPLTHADQAQVYQSLLTLSLNARDAILAARPSDGVIRITAAMVDGRHVHAQFPDATASRYVRVSVNDNGIGMSEEIRQRIFEPFITTEQPEGGRGLGLAMVYGVIKGHSGFIGVESSLGLGTTFSLYFPAVHIETEEAGAPRASEAPGGTETVLIVEDEEALLLLLVEVLRSKGYNVITAADGIEGLERYNEHRSEIKAVISDMGLPRQSGYDMFLKIRELDPRARVILASGYLNPALKSKLFVAGAKAFIPKPYQTSEVLRKLREVLDLAE
ncbi:MAG: PAS domain S-box protein [Bacteroidota bacterium]